MVSTTTDHNTPKFIIIPIHSLGKIEPDLSNMTLQAWSGYRRELYCSRKIIVLIKPEDDVLKVRLTGLNFKMTRPDQDKFLQVSWQNLQSDWRNIYKRKKHQKEKPINVYQCFERRECLTLKVT